MTMTTRMTSASGDREAANPRRCDAITEDSGSGSSCCVQKAERVTWSAAYAPAHSQKCDSPALAHVFQNVLCTSRCRVCHKAIARDSIRLERKAGSAAATFSHAQCAAEQLVRDRVKVAAIKDVGELSEDDQAALSALIE